MLVPLACLAGIRQVFTNTPSINTEHEPHSPSPHPSLVPVKAKSRRITSRSRSIGYTDTFFATPFTVNVIKHFSPQDTGRLMTSHSGQNRRPATHCQPATRQTGLPAAKEPLRIERPSRLLRH